MKDRPLRVLTIDGGGVRGIIPALVLQEIENLTNTPIADLFDLIVGTSTGGILTLGLTTPNKTNAGFITTIPKYRAADLVEFYQDKSKIIFGNPRTMGGYRCSKYDAKEIESVLQTTFGDTTIGQSLCEIITTSYCTELRRLVLFKSRKAIEKPHRNVHSWKAARATSAAPTYFPPYRLEIIPKTEAKTSFSLIDGGIIVNNPLMIGLKEAGEKYGARDIFVVSLGTGHFRKDIPYDSIKDAGYIGWGSVIIELLMSGASEITDTFATSLFNNFGNRNVHNYHRFQIDIDKEYAAMDDYNLINPLHKITMAKIKQRQSEIDQIAEALLALKSKHRRDLRYKGIVDNFSTDKGKGTGIISTTINGEQVPVKAHFSSIIDAEGYRSLTQGEPVELDISRLSDNKLCASRVRRIFSPA